MRKDAFLMGVLTMLIASSCTNDRLEKIPVVGRELEFHAVWADGPGTRTVLQSDGTSVWWTTGEEINAFYGKKFSGKFTSTNKTNQALVSFQGTLTVLTGTVEQGNEASAYWAVYPYNASNTCDGQSVTLTVPALQYAKQGSFANFLFPAIATSQNLDLAFYNVCGGVRFSVSQAGIQSVTFKSNNGEALAGKVKVGFGSDGYPEVQSVINGMSEVKVNAPSGGFVPGKYYFAVFLPQTLSEGISMTFKTSSQYATYTVGNSITVNRSRFGKLDEKDKGLTFNDLIRVSEVTLNKTSLKLYIGKERTLIATVLPENADDKSVTWSSSKVSIATVSSAGVVTGISVGSAVITVTTNDGAKKATCNVTVGEFPAPDAVDLGLPSGIKWASFNLGASKPEEYGDYYAWGETEPHYSSLDPLTWNEGKETGYTWASYKWCMGSALTLIKYCQNDRFGYNGFEDSLGDLKPEDDAAHVNLGGKWRIPGSGEFQELLDECTWEWTSLNGVRGRKATGPNGNSIFFPAAGSFGNTLASVGSNGYYWSRFVSDTTYPYLSLSLRMLTYNTSGINRDTRCSGLSIRAVTE